MPSDRLMLMGMLSKYPNKSPILRKFCNATTSTRYTKFEHQHITALYYTPELPPSWIKHQFAVHGADPEKSWKRLKERATSKKNRKYRHLGPRNVQFITRPEVERYYERRPKNMQATHPMWVIPVLHDYQKQGMSMRAIAEKLGIHHRSVQEVVKRNMFLTLHGNRVNNGRNRPTPKHQQKG